MSPVSFLQRVFELQQRGTNVRTELLAGATTFLTMSYIIVVQPAVLSGRMFGTPTGIDFGSVMTATCVAAALATGLMALYARAPIALAPGMGANFFFVLTLIPAAAAAGHQDAWQVALGVVLVAGVLFVGVTVSGLRRALVNAISPSLRGGIAVGIGLFIAFIGLQNAGLIEQDPVTAVRLNPRWLSPDLLVFFAGLLGAAALYGRGFRAAILGGIVIATGVALGLQFGPLPVLGDPAETSRLAGLAVPDSFVSLPPSVAPTFFAVDLAGALSLAMLPFVLVFLIMDLFDTVGTLIGVTSAAGPHERYILPRPDRAYLSDAIGTVAGAALGTSTVTSFIESATGIEQGGRTGLTSLTVAVLFLLALFASPLVAMIGSYPPITAPALVLVGALMLRNASRFDWDDPSEAIPGFLIALGIPLFYSISDGLALGFIAYPVVKLLSGRLRGLRWPMIVTALVMLAYVIVLRGGYWLPG